MAFLSTSKKTYLFPSSSKIAITPMGFCFPGLDDKGGDLPPRKECADLWQSRVSQQMPQIELVLLVGQYAQKYYLGEWTKQTLTATVADWRAILEKSASPKLLPLPHPSWRNNSWIKKNPWFSSELLPELKKLIQKALNS